MVAGDASKLVSEFEYAFRFVKLVRPVTFNDVNLLEVAYKVVKLVAPDTFNDVRRP